ncbi:hypothetical protein AVEN_171821-1 [Araneus ventricosus]|uniref:Uncharacterized protein n=1 Tax=Araneus ventricosus TaxID=182803 RepID=A0A4Y2LK97_ARAVE|nr:hypothetical protein AVEN_171821-1 [Araneus ventricosus]
MKEHVNRSIEKVEEYFQGVKTEIDEVQGNISVLQQRISDLKIRPNNIPASPEVMYSIPMVKSLTSDGRTSWTVFKTQFDIFYRTELKTRRQKPGENLQALAADVARLISVAYAECSQDVRDSLSAQYFVDAIRYEDTQHATRVMDTKDLKSDLAYSMKYETAKTVSKTFRNQSEINRDRGWYWERKS